MATLMMGRSSSNCGDCRRSANCNEQGHFTVLGYGKDNGSPGCGAIWTEVQLVYAGMDVDPVTIGAIYPSLVGLTIKWYGSDMKYHEEIIPGQMELPKEFLELFERNADA